MRCRAVRRSLTVPTVAGLGVLLAAAALPAPQQEPSLASAEATGGQVVVHMFGPAWATQLLDEREPDAVGWVHAVNRIPGATIVYFSIGYVSNGEDDTGNPSALFPAWGGHDRVAGPETIRGLGVIDPVAGQLYEPLMVPGTENLITSDPGVLPARVGQMVVGYMVTPELPEDVEVVDVLLARVGVVQSVPVGEGLLAPVVQPGPDGRIQLGAGWPVVPVDQVGAAVRPELAEAGVRVEPTANAVFALLTRTGDPTGAFIEEHAGEVTPVGSDDDDGVDATTEGGTTTLSLSNDVLFATGKSELTAQAETVLALAAERINDRATVGGELRIVGHADSVGSDESNMLLSQDRAKSVQAALEPLLQVEVNVVTEGWGETDPAASNETEEGRAQNRRVTISFTSETQERP